MENSLAAAPVFCCFRMCSMIGGSTSSPRRCARRCRKNSAMPASSSSVSSISRAPPSFSEEKAPTKAESLKALFKSDLKERKRERSTFTPKPSCRRWRTEMSAPSPFSSASPSTRRGHAEWLGFQLDLLERNGRGQPSSRNTLVHRAITETDRCRSRQQPGDGPMPAAPLRSGGHKRATGCRAAR